MTFMRNVKTLLSACVKVKQQCFSVIFSRVFTEFHRTERSVYSEKKEEKQTGDAFFWMSAFTVIMFEQILYLQDLCFSQYKVCRITDRLRLTQIMALI